MAGVVGFEPTMPGPKPGALPLGDTPTYYSRNNKHILVNMQGVFQLFSYLKVGLSMI